MTPKWLIVFFSLWAVAIVVVGFSISFSKPMPYAHIEKIDEDGTVWIQLSNMDVSDNTTTCVYYGDNISSQRMWILR